MTRWERVIFSLTALAVLVALCLKLYEIDLATIRFTRSFDIIQLNRAGDLIALFGDGLAIAGFFLLIRYLGWELKKEWLRDMALRGIAAMFCVAIISQVLKHLIGRPRPTLAHADYFIAGPTLEKTMDSFPSGHSFSAFAAAAVVGWFIPGLRIPVFILAGFAGLVRVLRGSHFPTDVLAGAVMGVVVGSLVASGWKRWGEEVLPALLRTGVPITVSIFLVIWVASHPMQAFPVEVWRLVLGVSLIALGGTLRCLAVTNCGRRGEQSGSAGVVCLMLGVAIASGPSWIVAVLLIALLPRIQTAVLGRKSVLATAQGARQGPSTWTREAVLVGVALFLIPAIRSVTGIFPIG